MSRRWRARCSATTRFIFEFASRSHASFLLLFLGRCCKEMISVDGLWCEFGASAAAAQLFGPDLYTN